MKWNNKKYFYIFMSILLLYVNSSAGPLETEFIGVKNANSQEVEELQDFITDQMTELQDKCVSESTSTAALIRFSFTTLNFQIMNMTTFVPEFSIARITGPILPSEMITTSGLINGPWRIASGHQAQYVEQDYKLFDGYISRVLMEYIAVPGTACPGIANTPPCPNAWDKFVNGIPAAGVKGMWDVGIAINSRSPSTALVRPVINTSCDTLDPSVVDEGTLTNGDFVAVPPPAMSPTPPERGYKKF